MKLRENEGEREPRCEWTVMQGERETSNIRERQKIGGERRKKNENETA